jgi:iron complex outermembrane receptor protein
MSKILAGALPLALLAAPAAALAETTPLEPVVVTATEPPAALSTAPNTTASVSAEAIARTVNLLTPEDTLRYLPDILVRQRHIGDTQAPVTTRTSGVGASARSLIYVDGMLISSLIGNNNTSASPKWGLISPDAVARVDVLYGPFSAAYAGNSIGAVLAFTTRMPTGFEATADAQGAWQSFSKYRDSDTYATSRFAGSVGDRLDRFAFRVSYNRLDSYAQPLTYATATVPSSTSASGTPVTGAFADANRTGQPIQVLGSTGIEHQIQDNASGRATFDVTPQITAAYTFGVFHNDDDATVNSYLRDGSGAAVYAGQVNIGGRAYTIAPSAFSAGVYRMDELELSQGLSLASHTGGAFDFELVATTFDYLHSRQRIPSGALPAAFSGGPGSSSALDGTGWYTLDANGTWRPPGGAHVVSFGAHQDGFKLNSPRYGLNDWIGGPDVTVQSISRGVTQTQALWAQDAWALTPQLKATVGGRWESWLAGNGLNFSASPALNVTQPHEAANAFSPKGVLAWSPLQGWTFKGSVGVAYRFPTVTELYQSVTVGTLLQTPNPNLKPERALSSELSAERAWSSGSLRLSVFDERITGALLSQTALLPSGASASFVQNVDRTRATGVELVGEQRDLMVKGLSLSGWVTFVDARTEQDKAFAAAVGKQLPQLPRLRGAVVATWSPTDRLDVSVAGRYSDRSFGTIDNSDPYANTYQGFSGYFVADVHAQYRVTPHLTAGLGVDNLNDRSYFLFHPFPQRTVVLDLKYSY